LLRAVATLLLAVVFDLFELPDCPPRELARERAGFLLVSAI
jgi:hypothetical protein